MSLIIAGCDEVGRGCLAGPVVAAAVILPTEFAYPLLKDSKQLTPKQRIVWDASIRKNALDWGIGLVTVEEVDTLNVLNAAHLAMHRAIDQLQLIPELLLIDGHCFKPYAHIKHQCLIRGDQNHSSIAAASIIAKVYRDQYMQELAVQFPGYYWEHNMGYPTIKHKKAIEKLGVNIHHRTTFRYIADQLQAQPGR
jgi:ribonuclease HII